MVALTMGFLGACAGPMLDTYERKHVCHVAVEPKFVSVGFHPHEFSNPGGGLAGTATGALAGLSGGYLAIFTIPLGAALGAAAGTACALANESHPNAHAEFELILRTADAGSLARGLEAGLEAPRAGCAPQHPDASGPTPPDTLVEIEQVDVTMGCAFGRQVYDVAVKWRVTSAITKRELVETTTHCFQQSTYDVDSWLADPDRSRIEIERVLERTGRRMAVRLLAESSPLECKFRSAASGAIEDR
jgi:hypothetical protein